MKSVIESERKLWSGKMGQTERRCSLFFYHINVAAHRFWGHLFILGLLSDCPFFILLNVLCFSFACSSVNTLAAQVLFFSRHWSTNWICTLKRRVFVVASFTRESKVLKHTYGSQRMHESAALAMKSRLWAVAWSDLLWTQAAGWVTISLT